MSETHDDLSLVDIVNSPEQRSAALWEKASKLLETYPRQLTRVASAKEWYVISPWITPGDHQLGISKGLAGHRYALAGQLANRRAVYERNNPMFMVIDDNVGRPFITFSQYASGLQALDGSDAFIENGSAETLVGMIEATTKESAEKRRSKRIGVGVLSAVIAVGGGVTGALLYHFHEEKLAKQNAIEAYDAKHIVLPVQAIKPGLAEFVPSMPQYFNHYVPSMSANALSVGSSPREVTLTPTPDCYYFGADDNNGVFRILTDAPNQQVLAGLDSQNKLRICDFSGDMYDKFILQATNK